jgi:hypothetical protein
MAVSLNASSIASLIASLVACSRAARVSRRRLGRVALLALCAPLLAASSAALAMGAAAPFAAPPRVAVPAAAAASAAADPLAPAVANAASAANAANAIGAGLSGIHLGTRPRALIDGDWVALGETVRGARLHALRADEAQLRHPDGRLEHLRFTPLVELHARPHSSSLPAASRWGAARTVRPSPPGGQRPQAAGASVANISESP